jgi:S1-C subfamily serine protease
MSNKLRLIILGVALAMGITCAVMWKAWKTTRTASEAIANDTSDPNQPFKIRQPSTQPSETSTNTLRPPQGVVVKVKLPPNPQMILARNSFSVLRIVAHDAKGEPIAQGSGFVVGPTGLVVTNYHVIKGSHAISVLLENKKRLEVEGLAAVDPDGNLALIKVKGVIPPPLLFSKNDSPSVGTEAYAIGNPMGLKNTLSEGEVKSVRKEGNAITIIHTSAAITPGSSGGPLLDEDGKVLGVATHFMTQGESQNLAIGRDRVQKLLDSYKGGIIPPAKQVWVSNSVEREQIAHWLTKAAAEAPKMVSDRSRVCGWIAEGYARSGDKKGLAKVLEFMDMADANWQQHAAAAGMRARAGDAEGASADVDKSSNQRYRLHAHMAIAAALRDRGDTAGFAREISVATEVAKAQKDATVRGDWLVMIAKACADSAQFEPASSVIALLADTADPNLNAKAGASGTKRNFKSSAMAHVAVGKTRAGDHDGAMAMAQEMFDEFDKSYVYMCIAEQRAKANETASALATAYKVSVPYMKNRAMLDVAEGAARASDAEKARESIGEAVKASAGIKEGWRKKEADLRLIGVLALAGDFPSAEKMAAEFKDDSGHSAAMGVIVVALAKRGDFKGVAANLPRIKDNWAAASAFSEIAVLQARSGQLRAAMRTIERIPNVDVRSEATRAIVKAAAGKLPTQMIAENAAAFTLPEQKAAAYLGLAEGIMDKSEAAAQASIKE